MPPTRTVLLALLLAAAAAAETGAQRLAKLRDLTFLPEQCYRVRYLFLEREDFKLHFSDGYLLFAQPVGGRAPAILFLAATDTGEAEVILIPPIRSERQSMARFLEVPVLQESVRTALMFFTDDTEDALRAAMAENPFNRPDPEAGRKLTEDWAPVARNLITSYETRMLLDSFSARGPDGQLPPGFFSAVLSGTKLGRFDILVDPRRREQISVGQLVWQEGLRFYDIWTSFPSRSSRGRRATRDSEPLASASALENYRIEAVLSPELDMQVTARATLVGGASPERAIPFELSRQLKVNRVLFDGQPAEFLQNEALDSSAVRQRGNDLVILVLEQFTKPGARHEVEFHYQGNVVTETGKGVYYVGERGNWYPSRGLRFTRFDLLFHYPKRLQLVATGREVESSVQGETRAARWIPDRPIRLAGFNLGDFERTSVRSGEYTVEVCANKNLEPALQLSFSIPDPLPLIMRRPPRQPAFVPAPLPLPEPPPSPVRRIEQVARDSAEALEFFVSRFGPPAVPHLTISPIPGRFGQGFPGLVFVSTLSYYQPQDKPLERFHPAARLFYSEQLRAHEIAHQWWGNLVTTPGYRDVWLMESLADYSALLFLEQQKGPRVLDGVLEHYKENLLARLESGETMESAGAIVLGERLRTSKTPRAQRIITYEKGAWVLHMLRRLMGGQKFFSFLGELRRRFEYKPLSTEQFRELAAQFLPAVPQDPNLENFFFQWVYSTGIPTLKMDYKVSGKAPRVRLTGTVRQSGVAEDFSVPVPIEIQLPGRSERIEIRVPTGSGEAPFSVALETRPTRVQLDPRDSVLAVK